SRFVQSRWDEPSFAFVIVMETPPCAGGLSTSPGWRFRPPDSWAIHFALFPGLTIAFFRKFSWLGPAGRLYFATASVFFFHGAAVVKKPDVPSTQTLRLAVSKPSPAAPLWMSAAPSPPRITLTRDLVGVWRSWTIFAPTPRTSES